MNALLVIAAYVTAGVFLWPLSCSKNLPWIGYTLLFPFHRAVHSLLSDVGCGTVIVTLGAGYYALEYFGIDPWSFGLQTIAIGWGCLAAFIVLCVGVYRLGVLFSTPRRKQYKPPQPVPQPRVVEVLVERKAPVPLDPWIGASAEYQEALVQVANAPVDESERGILYELAKQRYLRRIRRMFDGQ